MTITPAPTGPEPTGPERAGSAPAARLERIVVGVDDSPESWYALDLAMLLGRPTPAAISVVHVRARAKGLAVSAAGSVEYEQAEDALDAEIRRIAGERLGTYPPVWDVVVRRGHVAHELLALADEVDADLVVVGHRSHGPLRDAILGSVASSTVHHSRRNVLVAVPPR